MSDNVCCFIHAYCYADLTQRNREIDDVIKLYITIVYEQQTYIAPYLLHTRVLMVTF